MNLDADCHCEKPAVGMRGVFYQGCYSFQCPKCGTVIVIRDKREAETGPGFVFLSADGADVKKGENCD